MPYTDVKITDLAQVNSIQKDDLFLVSHPLKDSTGTIQETPYTSNSISGGALSSTIKSALESDDLSVTGKWNFKTTAANFPTQNARFAISDFLNALKTPSCLNSIVADGYDLVEHGWYHDLPTSIVQDKNKITVNNQSLSVMNNAIPNIDFVQRAIAGAYQSVTAKIETTVTQNIASFIPSHVGQVIYSTRLNSESAVRDVYGRGQIVNNIQYPDTHWIQHSGYILSGASSGVSFSTSTSGSGAHNKKDGGSTTTDISLAVNNLPAHNHVLGSDATKGASITGGSTGSTNFVKSISTTTVKADGVVASSQAVYPIHTIKTSTSKVSVSGGSFRFGTGTTAATTSKTNNTGNGTKLTVNTFPPVKRVYIWERIS